MKRRIIAALMCLCMLVGLLPMSAFAAPAELQPGEMNAWKSATYDPDEDTVEITLHVQGKDIEQEIPKEKPVDVVLVVDNSGSMEEQFDDQAMCPGTEEDIVHGDWLFGFWYYCSVCGRYRGWSLMGLNPPTGDCEGPMNKIAAARGAAYTLVNELAASNEANRIAVVSFESSILSGASIGLTALNSEDNLKKVTDTIEAMRANGGTNYTAALAKAQEYLSGSDREKYVIFISDGAPGRTGESYNDPDWNGVDQANALKQDGTTIYTIGLNVPGDAMSRLATEGKDRSFTDLDNLNQTLPTLIKEIVEEIQKETRPAGTDITFVDYINTEKFTLVENQNVSGLTFDYESNTVTWTLDKTNGEDQTVSFKVKPNGDDVYGENIPTNSGATYSYKDYNGNPQGPKDVDSATVNIQRPGFVITSSAGGNGSIAPAGQTSVATGGSQSYTFTPNDGYVVDTVTIDATAYVNNGSTVLPGSSDWSSYSFTNVQKNHEITVTFAEDDNEDKIPDKYQVFVKYVSADNETGTVQGFDQVINIPAGSTAVDVTTGVAVAQPNQDCAFDYWTVSYPKVEKLTDSFMLSPKTFENVKGGTVITFTAYFKAESKYQLNFNTAPGNFANGDTYTQAVREIDLAQDGSFPVKLPDGVAMIAPTYENDGKSENAVFAYWTAEQQDGVKIYGKDDDVLPVESSSVSFQSAYEQTVYAVWSKDENGNGIPDIEEDTYTLTIDPNGGKINGSNEAYKDPTEYWAGDRGYPSDRVKDLLVAPEKAALVGWSLTDTDGKIYETDDQLPKLLQFVEFSDEDIIVYAVWGVDEDGDGHPDFNSIQIKPSDIEIYVGGTGYDSVIDEEGGNSGEITHDRTNGFPEPGFEVTLPANLKDLDMSKLFLEYQGESETIEWKFEKYGEGDHNIYRIVPCDEENGRHVRMQFTKGNLIIDEDNFKPELNLNQTLTMEVYGDGIEKDQVFFVYKENGTHTVYNVSAKTGELTVRGTTEGVKFSNDTKLPEAERPKVAETDPNTFYTINNSDVVVTDDTNIALLFDEIVDGDKVPNYTALLKGKIDAEMGGVTSGKIRNYQYKYLDLVDYNNGNAWVAPSEDVTISWPLPEDIGNVTEVTVWHFAGIDRSMSSEEITAKLQAADYEPVKVTNVSVKDGFAVFQTDGFSPYVLTWETKDPAAQVNVTFNAGAHGTIKGDSTTTVAKGKTLSSSQIPDVNENTNYSFSGWLSSADGKVYTNEKLLTLTIDKDTTFTAQYTYNDPGQGGSQYDHYVYYDPNFNGAGMRNDGYDTGEKVTVRYDDWFERDGYIFVEWNTEKDGTGTSYDPDDTFTMPNDNVYLYAQWQKDKTGPDDSGVSNWLETDEHNAYLSGYPDSTFRADRNMTRAEVAQMFYALLLDKNVTITKSFSDVPDDAWYATAVKTLASLGMMDGYPDGTFRPDEPITRAEFATVGLAFAYDPLDASCSYYDVGANAWYYTYVAQATTYGWIGGYPDNTFRPGNNITRVEVCVIVNNMLGRDADERYIDRNEDELVHFVDLSDSYWGYYTIMESTNTHEYTGSFTNEKWTDVK